MTSMRRHYVALTSCASWEFDPHGPPIFLTVPPSPPPPPPKKNILNLPTPMQIGDDQELNSNTTAHLLRQTENSYTSIKTTRAQKQTNNYFREADIHLCYTRIKTTRAKKKQTNNYFPGRRIHTYVRNTKHMFPQICFSICKPLST